MPTIADYHNALVPEPHRSESQYLRFYHKDISDLSNEQLWGESHVLTDALALAYFERQKPCLLFTGSQDEPTSDQEWMRDRLARLRSEQARRKPRAA